MIGLPEHGDRVKIYPRPGLQVQASEAPVDGGPLHLRGRALRPAGGRFLKEEGEEVIWSPFHHEQLRSGSIMLHPAHPDDPNTLSAKAAARAELGKKPPAKAAVFDPAKAADKHMHQALGEKAYKELAVEPPAAPAPAPDPKPAAAPLPASQK